MCPPLALPRRLRNLAATKCPRCPSTRLRPAMTVAANAVDRASTTGQKHMEAAFTRHSRPFKRIPRAIRRKLRAIILENITDDATISKRAIQAAAEEKLFAKINVICGREDFSYLVYTETFCQATNEESGITCYAFRMPTHDRYSEDL
ncbi:Ground-like domain-containing protein [Aphelenchoides fujianensis]|nr:Ground-like domain-containing protein [Aphelenchoides fujianensis]